MRFSLTIVYTTARRAPQTNWFLASLRRQLLPDEMPSLIFVDAYHSPMHRFPSGAGWIGPVKNVPPKPTIWQGEHRITKEDWWAKSNALNTGICLCETEWIAFCDDRCVLGPHWMQSIRHAMDDEYAVCGSYEKRANMKVEAGEIIDMGTDLGSDHRPQLNYPQPTKDWYGGSGALPLEWCLAVNGFNESYCDGLGLEDAMFGVTLFNSGFPICYDARMRIIEDRTQGQIDGALKRSDYGVSPNDASHKIVELLDYSPDSKNPFQIREIRNRVLAGEPFPPSSLSHTHFFTGQPISELT